VTKKEKAEVKANFEKVMDSREKVYSILQNYEKKNGFVPAEYQKDHRFMAAYEEYKRIGGWRNNKLVAMLIKKAIKKAIKNNCKSVLLPK
jgi:hypothetical protein